MTADATGASRTFLPVGRGNAIFMWPGVFLLALMLTAAGASSQSDSPWLIRGTVVDDSTNTGLEFVNVLLLSSKDSALVTGTVTEQGGKFEFKHVREGEFVLRFSLLGYQDKRSAPFLIDSLHRRLNVGVIALQQSSVRMEEVTITAERPIIEHLTDRMVYHVNQDIGSQTSSASEVLENIPSVQVDIDGEVRLRGSKRVLVMINGKRSPVLEKQEGVFLDQLPASAIERVEVITTPSARYRSEGKSGIINIILKRDSPLGVHGTVSAHGGSAGRANAGARLNYNPGSLNLFGSFSVRRDNKDHRTSDVREIQSNVNPSLSSTYSDTLFSYYPPVTQLASFGIDYTIDNMNTLGASYNYFQNAFDRSDYSQRILRNIRNVAINVYDRDGGGYEFDKENSASAKYQHDFGRIDHTLKVDYSYAGSPATENYSFKNTYLEPAFPSLYDNTRNSQRDDRNQVAVDYSNAFASKSTIEAGYTRESDRTILDFTAEHFDGTQNQFVFDTSRSSSYHFFESLHSGYVTVKSPIGKLGILAGLRIESDRQESYLVNADSSIVHTSVDFFPSLHLSYSLGRGKMVKVSYSPRISRPKPRELNPYAEYRDPRSPSFGNPELLPEHVQSIEAGYQVHSGGFFIHPSLFFRHTSNGIFPYKTAANRSTLVTNWQNIRNEKSVGLEIEGSFDVEELTIHLNAAGIYEEMDATNLEQGLLQSDLAWNGTLTCGYKIGESSKIQLHSHVNSLRLTPQGTIYPSFTVNLGFRQEFFDGDLALTATGTDLFKTLIRHSELDIPGLRQVVYTTRESQIFFVGVTYRFGTVLPQSEEDQFHYEED